MSKESRLKAKERSIAARRKAALKAGDTVLYGKYAGTEVSVDGKDYLIMRQSDVVAVLG